jgi:hypothetical protein
MVRPHMTGHSLWGKKATTTKLADYSRKCSKIFWVILSPTSGGHGAPAHDRP